MALILTKLENHRTKSQQKNSLIYKTFIFQFLNNYASLFYLAYFRNIDYPNGLFNMGPEYTDKCEDTNCMGLLSVQILTYLSIKMIIPFLKDFLWP